MAIRPVVIQHDGQLAEQRLSGTAPQFQQEQDFAPGIERAFPARFQESDSMLEYIEGTVPDFVRGHYYLNGPALFSIAGFSYRHWLDGDGMTTALHFESHQVRLTNRYIRSTKFKAEEEAGRPLFRTFGTRFDNSRLNRVNNGLESPVNVSIYPAGDRLLAFGEQGLPWELDPVTLTTVGQYTFNGRLNDASPFSAHPKFDVESDEMFNFGVFFSEKPKLCFYSFGAEGLCNRKSISLELPCSVHDFSISKNYAVFYLSPYVLNLSALFQNENTIMDALDWQPNQGSRLLVLKRESGEPVASIPIGNRYCLHLINAFEQDDYLMVDVLEFDEPIYGQYHPVPSMFQTVSPGGPARFLVDLKKNDIVARRSIGYLHAPDFPSIDPRNAMRKYNDFWMLGISSAGQPGRKFFDELVHATWDQAAPTDIYRCPAGCYLGGEPVFIGAPGSPEGAVICQEFNARSEKSSFLLFDAYSVSRGPIARLQSHYLLPLGFHASFAREGS